VGRCVLGSSILRSRRRDGPDEGFVAGFLAALLPWRSHSAATKRGFAATAASRTSPPRRCASARGFPNSSRSATGTPNVPQSVIVVNADGPDKRVALIESGILSELYIERERARGTVGNVYKGKVLRVLPGMQAAFVDIGEEKAAFLYAGDIAQPHEDDTEIEDHLADSDGTSPPRRSGKVAEISTLVRPGQEILVQVVKDPISNKGARITSYVSLPGRNVVFMPTVSHIGISRRIA